MITYDCETYDPELSEHGPGVYRKDGYVLGVAIKEDDKPGTYHPLVGPERPASMRYLEKVLSSNEDKLAANGLYDIDWLQNFEGLKINGKLFDVQYAEPLLDEYASSYSVDAMAQRYLGQKKGIDEIAAYCASKGWGGIPQKHLKDVPVPLVAKYAISDVDQEYAIHKMQLERLASEDLMPLYEMECALTPLLVQMRKAGLRLDRDKRMIAAKTLRAKYVELDRAVEAEYGAFNHNSTVQLAEIFDRLKLPYGRTATGRPSIKTEDLERIEHPFAHKVLSLRQVDKIYSTFVMGAFVDYDVDGRIHCSFYPLRQDEGGTVSGRFSSQNPNLQQVPGKDKTDEGLYDFGKLVRGLFVPEDDCWYGKIDYSQIEYRVIAHYARGPKSDEVRELYRTNPKTDYHQLVIDWTKQMIGKEISRGDAKRLNFGFAYFMGAPAMSRKFNWPMEKAEEFKTLYNTTMPFIGPTRTAVVNVAKGRGYIRTILGRKARVSDEIRENKKEYVMFNRLIQGSAADINKKAMVNAYNAGLFNVLTPHVTVHDELGVSVPKTAEGIEAYRELKRIMETSVELRVPIVAEAEIGPSWGEVNEFKWEDLYAEIRK